jgi:hypothetical protein
VSTKTMTATETLGALLPTITAVIRAATSAKTGAPKSPVVADLNALRLRDPCFLLRRT